MQISSGLEVILGYFGYTNFGVLELSRVDFTKFGVLEFFWNHTNHMPPTRRHNQRGKGTTHQTKHRGGDRVLLSPPENEGSLE